MRIPRKMYGDEARGSCDEDEGLDGHLAKRWRWREMKKNKERNEKEMKMSYTN